MRWLIKEMGETVRLYFAPLQSKHFIWFMGIGWLALIVIHSLGWR